MKKTQNNRSPLHSPLKITPNDMLTTKALFSAEGMDERSLEFLAAAIEKNNLPGFDYFEYKRAVTALLQMNIDEATAHKSAYTTAAQVGLTKEKLLETAAYYRNLLSKEREQFDLALENQNQTKITSRLEEVKRLRDQIERHKAEVARLQDEIADYLNRIQQAEESAKTESEKLEKAKSAFEKTQSAITLLIDKDIEAIHKHI
jgi:chromosome segregation ATPase